jgi:hypothetical protein
MPKGSEDGFAQYDAWNTEQMVVESDNSQMNAQAKLEAFMVELLRISQAI